MSTTIIDNSAAPAAFAFDHFQFDFDYEIQEQQQQQLDMQSYVHQLFYDENIWQFDQSQLVKQSSANDSKHKIERCNTAQAFDSLISNFDETTMESLKSLEGGAITTACITLNPQQVEQLLEKIQNVRDLWQPANVITTATSMDFNGATELTNFEQDCIINYLIEMSNQ